MSVAVPLHEIRAEFAELDDPVDRTTYLIEIGRTLPPLDEHLQDRREPRARLPGPRLARGRGAAGPAANAGVRRR